MTSPLPRRAQRLRAGRFKVRLHRRHTPVARLLDDLRKTSRRAPNRRLSWEFYDRHGHYSGGMMTYRFGSWKAALRAAGLPVRRSVDQLPTEALLHNIARVWRRLGRQPLGSDMIIKDGHSHYPLYAYCRRFGTWNKALQAFDAFANGGRAPREARPARRKKRARRGRQRPRTIPTRLRAAVLARDHCLCRMCGNGPAKDPTVTLHVDHIRPWSKGGPTWLGNLQTLCASCNLGKHDRSLMARPQVLSC